MLQQPLVWTCWVTLCFFCQHTKFRMFPQLLLSPTPYPSTQPTEHRDRRGAGFTSFDWLAFCQFLFSILLFGMGLNVFWGWWVRPQSFPFAQVLLWAAGKASFLRNLTSCWHFSISVSDGKSRGKILCKTPGFFGTVPCFLSIFLGHWDSTIFPHGFTVVGFL